LINKRLGGNKMFEIRENNRKLPDGTEIKTFSRDIINANILEVEAGTTGYMGGDIGSGSRTYFRIKDLASPSSDAGFEVVLGGDSELTTIIQALKFIVKVLDEESAHIQD
jgi:hypothetical protein